MDATVRIANRYGIHLLPVLGYAPRWTRPEDARGYARFVAAAVRRYGPGTKANLTWFELWNEPTYEYRWSGKEAEPMAYARDVRAASAAAKSIAPSIKLLMYADYEDAPQKGTTPWQLSMIDDYFKAVPDLAHWIDGIAVHPYSDDPSRPVVGRWGWKDRKGDWAFGRVDQIRRKFLAHGADLPMWITEIGWSTYNHSPAQQARYYRDLGVQVRKRPWIRALFSFCLREFERHPRNDQSGLRPAQVRLMASQDGLFPARRRVFEPQLRPGPAGLGSARCAAPQTIAQKYATIEISKNR